MFDRSVKQVQRDRTALLPDWPQYEVLHDQVAWLVADRVNDIKRSFRRALDVGCRRGNVGRHLDKDMVAQLTQCDSSKFMLQQFHADGRDKELLVHCDEENLPFEHNYFELVTSSLALHWVNDLPRTLRQIHNVLVPDGAFVGAMFGADTLFELRCALQLAEEDRRGGMSQHVSPFTQVRDMGGLLSQAGFTLLTVDVDEIVVNYPSMFELVSDLKNMGENNAALSRCRFLSNDTLLAAAAVYQEMYGNKENGTIPATFDVIHMVAWKPDPSQSKPLEKGCATHSLRDLGIINPATTKNNNNGGNKP